MKYEVLVQLATSDFIEVEADSEEDAIEEAKEIFQDCFTDSKWWKDISAEVTEAEED